MDNKISTTLLVIACGALSVGGLILLLISMFSETRDNWSLYYGLAAISLGNLFNLIRVQRNRKTEQNKNGEKKREGDVDE